MWFIQFLNLCYFQVTFVYLQPVLFRNNYFLDCSIVSFKKGMLLVYQNTFKINLVTCLRNYLKEPIKTILTYCCLRLLY